MDSSWQWATQARVNERYGEDTYPVINQWDRNGLKNITNFLLLKVKKIVKVWNPTLLHAFLKSFSSVRHYIFSK